MRAKVEASVQLLAQCIGATRPRARALPPLDVDAPSSAVAHLLLVWAEIPNTCDMSLTRYACRSCRMRT